MASNRFDLVVVGGGLSGTAVARDAAGRGLSVLLVERDDLASGGTSATRGMAHGALAPWQASAAERDLLARERERLLHQAPHLVERLACVWPVHPDGPGRWSLGRALRAARRAAPAAPRVQGVKLAGDGYGRGLSTRFTRAVVGSEASLDAPRLAVLMARDAADRGATIAPRHELRSATVEGGAWQLELARGAEADDVVGDRCSATALVLAAGGWSAEAVGRVQGALAPTLQTTATVGVLVRRIHDGEHAVCLPRRNAGPITLVPWQHHWTLVAGEVTDALAAGDDAPSATVEGLLTDVNPHLAEAISTDAVLRTSVHVACSAGRADDVATQTVQGAPLACLLGARHTTVREVAERAVSSLAPSAGPEWTADAALPGGEIPDGDLRRTHRALGLDYPHMRAGSLAALMRRHGMDTRVVLGDAERPRDLGDELAPGLSALELRWMVEHEWARTVDDVLWRRTQLGLDADDDVRAAVARGLEAARGA